MLFRSPRHPVRTASERMGHEVPGMRGVYSHITPGMRAELKARLQEFVATVAGLTSLAPTSRVAVLDELLGPQREPTFKIRSQIAPRIGHQVREPARHDQEAGG